MIDVETDLWSDFAHYVPTPPARALLLDEPGQHAVVGAPDELQPLLELGPGQLA